MRVQNLLDGLHAVGGVRGVGCLPEAVLLGFGEGRAQVVERFDDPVGLGGKGLEIDTGDRRQFLASGGRDHLGSDDQKEQAKERTVPADVAAWRDPSSRKLGFKAAKSG